MTTKQFDAYSDLITFTRASTATYLDSDGLLKSAATNTPRIEYDVNGNRLGLLIEEARTNSFTNSGDMDGTGWSGFRTTFSNGDTAPDGSQLFLLGTTSETNVNGSMVASQTPSLSAGVYTMSVFAKAGPNNAGLLLLRPTDNVNFTDAVSAWFNLETGSIAGVAAAGGSSLITTPSANIQNWGDGVYRCILTFTVTGSVSCAGRHYIADASGAIGVTIGKQVQLWGAQLETGSFPTSYIPTAGATATRAADVASIPTSAFGYNQKAGTVVCEFDVQYGGTTNAFPRIWEIGNSANFAQSFRGIISASTSAVRVGAFSNNASVADLTLKTQASPASGKIAFAFADNNFAGAADGGTVITATSGVISNNTDPRNLFKFGGATATANANINGHLKSIQYFPRRLTNTQIQRLTE